MSETGGLEELDEFSKSLAALGVLRDKFSDLLFQHGNLFVALEWHSPPGCGRHY